MKNSKNVYLEKIAAMLNIVGKGAKSTDIAIKKLQPIQNYSTKGTAATITRGT